MQIRAMTIEDYEQTAKLWRSIQGFGLRSVDDSKEGIRRFLLRNPGISVVAEEDGEISAQSCVDMMVAEAACIMFVWRNIDGNRGSDRKWLRFAWRH